MMEVLQGAVKARLNIIVSGGTGAGKTTLLNVLSSFISDKERIVTIEDSAELQLRQRHVVRLECRPPNVEGKGGVRARELVINALRMRPDRIVVGEVRGEEALDMLQAMNTGHDGSITTVHANGPRDALARIETMAMMANLNLPEKAVRQQIASAIQVIVQVSRMSDGTRRVTHISEIAGTVRRHRQHAGHLPLREAWGWAEWESDRQVHGNRNCSQVRGETAGLGYPVLHESPGSFGGGVGRAPEP